MKQASFPLPLDLHVLSLSLAFILSQDQTLHCILSYYIKFPNSRSSIKFLTVSFILTFPFLILHFLLFISLKDRFFFCNTNLISQICISSFKPWTLSERKGLQKYNLFLFPPNIFQYFFYLFLTKEQLLVPRKSGCKSRPFYLYHQIFLHVFWKKITNNWISIV